MSANGTLRGPRRPPISGVVMDESEAIEVSPKVSQLGGIRRTFRSLRHPNYRLYFFGQLVSLTGTWMQSAALTWLAFDLTGQSRWPAWLTACQLLPTFFLGAWGGSLADRWPKRSLLFTTQSIFLVLALVLSWIVGAGLVQPWHLLLISLANGIVVAIDLPARLAFVMEMVGRDDLINAVALNSLLFNGARIAGPALAGILLTWLGPSLCFFCNGVSYLAVLWALMRMNVGTDAAATHSRESASLGEGLRFLAQRPRLAVLVLLAGVLAVCGWPVLALLPGLAQRTLAVRESGYTLMLIAVGIGALAAAVRVATFGSVGRQGGFVGTGLGAVTVALIGLSFAGQLLPATVCCAVLGFGLILFLSTSQGVVQLGAGDHNRGLIMGIWAMVQSGGLPLGNLLTGPAADVWGERWIVRIQGLMCGAATLVVLALFSLRRQSELGRTARTRVTSQRIVAPADRSPSPFANGR